MNDQTADGADGIPANYEIAVSELEKLVARMESGELSLEASLAAYQRGSVLVAYCQQQLEKVEQQVRVLDGDMLKPFMDGESTSSDSDESSDGF